MVTHIFISLQQNNLSNPPTPPASLPPTPPPVARQKLLNGFATTEELASKGGVIVGHDGEQFIAIAQNKDKTTFRSQNVIYWTVDTNVNNCCVSTVTKGLFSRPLQLKSEEELLARALAQGPKTVNVPASLPTPPHNNQEELRSVDS